VTSFLAMSALMTMKDPELPKYGVFIDFCKILETAMKWLEID